MLNSFKYMFIKKDFIKNFLYMFFIIFCANLLINWSGTLSPALNGGQVSVFYYLMFVAGFVVMFIPYGYSISLLRSTLQHGMSAELPKFDIVSNFVSGLKVVLSGSLLIILLAMLVLAYNMILKVSSTFINSVLNALLFFIVLMILYMGIAMCCRYVIKPSFTNFINFKAAADIINKNAVKYSKVFLLSAITTVIVYLISFLSVSVLTAIGYVGLVIYCIIVSALWTYQIYLFAGLFSNAVSVDNIK